MATPDLLLVRSAGSTIQETTRSSPAAGHARMNCMADESEAGQTSSEPLCHFASPRGAGVHAVRTTIIDDDAFDPETLDILGTAFVRVCADLGVSPKARHSREFIAKRVLLLGHGQRDPRAIHEAVIVSLKHSHR
jgi:hypothetical protein